MVPATLHMCTGAGVVTLSQGFVGMLAWGGEIREMMCVLDFSLCRNIFSHGSSMNVGQHVGQLVQT